MKKPTAHVTLRSEEGESRMAHVQQSHVPAAVAGRLAQSIRTFLWLVCARQETTRTVSRLRRWLCGTVLTPTPTPAASSASSPAGGEEPNAGGVLDAEVDEGTATADAAPPAPAPRQAQGKAKGGQRPGTGRLGAAAYAGAKRLACRHEELAAGQRCPVCGQGTVYALPPGVDMRLDGHALLSAIRYELHTLRWSACGQIFTAPLPPEAGKEQYRPRARAV